MLTDHKIIEAIENSPLSPEDKDHWKMLLPKLNAEQRERLHHSLTAKTEVIRAVKLIEKALDVIAEAEAEAEEEVEREDQQKLEKQQLLQDLEAIKEKEDEILFDENTLKKKQEETQAQIAAIREELKKLSLEAHGKVPPSYRPQPSPS